MSSQTHSVHDVKVTAGLDHPFGTRVEVDGRPVETARSVDIHLGLDEPPSAVITHGCATIEYVGVATVEHRCGAIVEPDDSPTGYLAVLKVVLRGFASDVLLKGDVFGLQRETVLDELEANLDRMAATVARAVLDGAPQVNLRRLAALPVGSAVDPDGLVIEGDVVRKHDLDPGVHAVIRFPGGAERER